MSNEKFTKGPWSLNFTGPHWNNPELRNIEICYGTDTECICDTVYEEADAHLIAAAPEMYEMLDSICDLANGDVNNITDEMLCYFDRIELLLAKARGKS